jgi:galactitol-specific phosphotransferase system IIC component
MPNVLLAQIDIDQIATNIASNGNFNLPETGTQITSPSSLYYNLLIFFTWAVGIIAVLVIIYSGIQYISAAGDAEKAERAKKTMIGAIIGIVIIIIAYSAFNTTMKILSAPNAASTSQIQNQMQQNPSTP